MNPTEDHSPSCRDLVGLLAQTGRRAAYAALALGLMAPPACTT